MALSRPYLLLGEAPNAATQHHPRLWLLPDGSGIPHSANRLLEYTGYDLETYLTTFDRDNLLHHLPRRDGKGRGFPIVAARRGARRIFDGGDRHRGILVLGKRVARAFRWLDSDLGSLPLAGVDYLTWFCVEDPRGLGGIPAVVVPHPSGINRWWNDAGNRAMARGFFVGLLRR